MNSCPCCDQQMVVYAGKNRLYWFCSHCHQEMPDLLSVMMSARQKPETSGSRRFAKEVLA